MNVKINFAADSKSSNWTDQQVSVIESNGSTRTLIQAGPGTGKTSTACARIAWLISCADIDPSEIWLISFTRTAIHELRNRISSFLRNPSDVHGLRIATIDSLSWAIHSGYKVDAKMLGSFEDNIEKTIELVKTNEDVSEFLKSVKHLVIDEAQDIVGVRSELLLELINALPDESGVSVFADDAQAIYGFSEESNDASSFGTLPEMISQHFENFNKAELTEIHRTADEKLIKIFSKGRKIITESKSSNLLRLESIRNLLHTSNHADIGLYRDDIQDLPISSDDSFLLFRRRGEVLDASSYFSQASGLIRPHRIRMSGLPTCIHGWISVIFWDWLSDSITESQFFNLWSTRLGDPTKTKANLAWSILIKLFGRTSEIVSIRKMSIRLASPSPPYELTLPEFGSLGPILGTIHGSKGREVSEVRLYLPPEIDGSVHDDSLEEEANVYFVGATRAKSIFKLGRAATKTLPRALDPSGRAFTPRIFDRGGKVARAAVEVGRDCDLDAEGLVGNSLYASQEHAFNAQSLVMKLEANMGRAYAVQNGPESNWRYKLISKKDGEIDSTLGYLSTELNDDLFKIARIVDEVARLRKKLPPSTLNYLRTYGVRTLVLAPDDPVRELLHSPWRESGFIAVPMLLGYPFSYFRFGSGA